MDLSSQIPQAKVAFLKKGVSENKKAFCDKLLILNRCTYIEDN